MSSQKTKKLIKKRIIKGIKRNNGHGHPNWIKTYLLRKSFYMFLVLFLLSGINVNAQEIEKSRTTQYEFTEEENLVLQKIAIAEAQTEGIGGMAFVMQTVLNRVNSPDFPDTIYDVVSQYNNSVYQFTTFANGMYDKAQPTENSQKALDLLNILQNQGQLYFEVTCNNSWQSRNLTYVFVFKNHTFYK